MIIHFIRAGYLIPFRRPPGSATGWSRDSTQGYPLRAASRDDEGTAQRAVAHDATVESGAASFLHEPVHEAGEAAVNGGGDGLGGAAESDVAGHAVAKGGRIVGL